MRESPCCRYPRSGGDTGLRLSTIKKVDRILVIENGKIVEEGSHSKLVRKKDGVYREFYELQAGGFIGE